MQRCRFLVQYPVTGCFISANSAKRPALRLGLTLHAQTEPDHGQQALHRLNGAFGSTRFKVLMVRAEILVSWAQAR